MKIFHIFKKISHKFLAYLNELLFLTLTVYYSYYLLLKILRRHVTVSL